MIASLRALAFGVAVLGSASACSHPLAAHPSAGRGAALFAAQCAACHGSAGAGGPIAPGLRGERSRKARAAIVEAIESPLPPMPKLFPGTLSAQDVADVSAYVESL